MGTAVQTDQSIFRKNQKIKSKNIQKKIAETESNETIISSHVSKGENKMFF